MQKHEFAVKGNWQGGMAGNGSIQTNELVFETSAPEALGGIGTGTNPEQLLLASAATCYLITLGSLLEPRKFPVKDIGIRSVGTVNKGQRFTFESIVHYPVITTTVLLSNEQQEKLIMLAKRAEQICMISRAIGGNVALSIEPSIIDGSEA